MDAKHCEKSPDCCHPWDDSCSCDCNGCDPVRTCPDCGDRFRSHGGHGASACLHTLRTRLTAAERERDEARALLRECRANLVGRWMRGPVDANEDAMELAACIDNHLRGGGR